MMVRLEFNDMADEQLRKALALDPRLPHANLLLGQNAVFRNRLEEGIEYFRKELAINPGNATALYRLGEAYSRQSDWDKAIPALQRSLWINPYLQRPLHRPRPGVSRQGAAGHGRRHAAAGRGVRPEQQIRELPARAGPAAARA